MRPVKMTIKHFGPFAGTEEIDFEKFQHEGLFLINGQTGSGKTSILDAMTFAIYGEVLGLRGDPVNKKSDAVRLKSDYSDPETSSIVILEVDINGIHYRFTRSPSFMKPGNKTATNPRATLEIFDGASWNPLLSGVSEVNVRCVELLGLDKQQFAQLILLRQGGFADFLNAKNEDKGKLLNQLFSASTYESIQNWIKSQKMLATAAKTEIIYREGRIEASLRTVTGNDELQVSLETLESEIESANSKAIAFEAQVEAQTLTLSPNHTRLNNAEIAQNADEAIASAKATIEKAKKELLEHITALEAIGITSPSSASVAEAKAHAENEISSAEALIQRHSKLRTLLDEQESHTYALDNDRATKTTLVNSIESDQEKIEALKSSQVQVQNLESEKNELETNRNNLQKHVDILEQLARLEGQWTALDEDLRGAKDKQLKMQGSLIAKQKAYMNDVSAYLADFLVPDEECSVCGSTEHPKPAKSHPGTPSKTEIETAEKQLGLAKQAVNDIERDKAKLSGGVDELHRGLPNTSTLSQIRTQVIAIEAKIAELDSQIEAAESKANQIQLLEASTSENQIRLVAIEESIAEKKSNVDSTNGKIIASEEELKLNPQEAVKNALSTNQTNLAILREVGPKLAVIEEKITEAKAAMKANADAAKGKIENIEELRNEVKNAQAEIEELQREKTREQDIETKLKELLKKLKELLSDSAQALANEELWLNLESYTSGSVGRGVDLATFYLSYRLKQVLAAANHRLLAMTDGRYSLFHDESVEAAKGAKGGLAIMVNDSNSGQRRGPESLSGGETFMASLALALGLSDIVSAEAGGRRLEALFVDEGFGSLDPETLDQVMDSLDELRSSGRMVGLVSHVESMKARVPAQIIVKKTNTGSTLELVGV